MKTKLLKKTRRKVKLYERNGLYYVETDSCISDKMLKKQALTYYRFWVRKTAENIFGFKPKSRLF
jgi:hypothetical protein